MISSPAGAQQRRAAGAQYDRAEERAQGRTSLDSLDFIEGYPPNMLIDNFSTFYQGRIAIFKYATHVLDMEDLIQENFLQTPLTSGGKPVTHYRFADSKSEPGIQLADIVVGVLGKMHSYFTETPPDEVAADRASLTGTSSRNAELLRDLIAASHEANIAFLQSCFQHTRSRQA